jgi:photosystem II stability/assembly factor-like uncharacterized protein
MVGYAGTIQKTTNGGTNWFSQSVGITQLTYTGVFFINALTGWICGGNPYPVNILLKTVDGGNNWMLQTPSSIYLLWGIFFINNQTGWSCGWHGTIIKTTNGGTNWFSQNIDTVNELYRVQFIDINTGFIVGTNGDIMKTTNGGLNWNHYPLGISTWLRWIYFPVSTSSSLTGWITGNNGLILKTTNSGNNWLTLSSGVSNNLGAVFFNNNMTGWIVGNSSGALLLKSNNGGINWIVQQTGATSQLGPVFFTNINTGWISGYSGLIMKTTNGGLALPAAPVLISPPNYSTNISLTPQLVWNSVPDANYYYIQLSPVSNFSVIADSATIYNTQYSVPPGKLLNSTTYFWRVNATNVVGTGPWSGVWLFSTVLSSGILNYASGIPDEFKLYNNFPNPFNPVTKFRFDVPRSGFVELKIYDALGAERAVLVSNQLSPGKYEFMYTAGNLTSGVYFYRLITKDYMETKRMIILK